MSTSKMPHVAQAFTAILGRLHVDRAVAITIFGRMWSALAGLITIGALSHFLSPQEQGFYYTFSSLFGIQVFFELGLSFVLIQMTAHEKAFLEWDGDDVLYGNAGAKARLASLFQLSVKWYSIISLLVMLLVLPAGWVFFSRDASHSVAWQLPWLMSVIPFSFQLLFVPLLAIREGCGRVADTAKIRLIQDVTGYLLFWTALVAGMGLLSVPLLYVGRLLSALLLVSVGKWKAYLIDLWQARVPSIAVSWRKEVFPFQWKIALSWMSGYLIFNLFSPLMFAYHGPIVAGQVGMTISFFSGITIISMSWVNARAPKFCEHIARQEFDALDLLFSRVLRASVAANMLGVATLCGVITVLQSIQHPFGERVISGPGLYLLAVVTIINHLVFALAAYLRAHKEEPLLVNSIVSGVLMLLSTSILGKLAGVVGLMAGYLLVALIGSVWACFIFFEKRRQWHHFDPTPDMI